MTPEERAAAIRTVLEEASAEGSLALPAAEIPDPRVERPRNRDHGDWSTNVAMQLAKKAGTKPRDLAELLVPRLEALDGIVSVEVAGPGFLNIRLDAASAGELARSIVEAGEAYGRNDSLSGQHINLEYVSANPTGPVHLGGARWAAVGDSLARILSACGAEVTREYYFNDHGTQIDRFARSLVAAAKGEATPEDGYGGDYIKEIAQAVVEKQPHALEGTDAEVQETFRAAGVEMMFDQIKASLHDFGVDFDVYFHENSLFESGAVDKAVATLKDNGNLYEAEGAWWLRSTDFGDDKDRVVIKSDGDAAYIAGDIAYVADKFDRGHTLAIYMLGADHHGYIARLKAAAQALGYNADAVEVLIGQMVNLVRDGQAVKMSKRAGTVITLDDLVDAIGVDGARYSLVRSSVDSTLDIDLDLWTKQSSDNPVYYVQYAHARLCSIERKAIDAGVSYVDPDLALLTHEKEGDLIRTLGEYPAVVRAAAELREPHRIARYLESLAATYHTWYGQCRVTPRGDDPVGPGHVARLWLNDAVTQVLRTGLGLLGVSAPERM